MTGLSAAVGGSSRAVHESSYFSLCAGMSFGGRPTPTGPLSNAVLKFYRNERLSPVICAYKSFFRVKYFFVIYKFMALHYNFFYLAVR